MKRFLIGSMAIAALFASCTKEEHDFSTTIEQRTEINLGSPYGEFVVVNKGTNDTLKLRNSEVKYSMTAHNGNFISIKFVPDQEHADRKFTTIYTLHDSTVVEDKPEYEYSITNTKPGSYNLKLFARPTDGTVISTWSCNLALKVED